MSIYAKKLELILSFSSKIAIKFHHIQKNYCKANFFVIYYVSMQRYRSGHKRVARQKRLIIVFGE